MIILNCCCQNYAWGKLGMNSEVAALCSACDKEMKVEEQPYAELWMGTHPKGPSTIKETGEQLSLYLAKNPNILGEQFSKVLFHQQPDYLKHGVQLPFLFKVLSVNQALSIQVHPTKEQGKLLHKTDPNNYPDDNHKPEMAIALTQFELLCGFRPAFEIVQHLKETPELFELVSGEQYNKLQHLVEKNPNAADAEAKSALKQCFSSLMNQPNTLIRKNLSILAERYALQLNQANISQAVRVRNELLIRLHFNYPGDVGNFAPFFLNHFVLQPGEATFLGPNEPHAYLYGDCIECMACSDNTIRAGLTPKFKDISRLVEMLTYRMASAQDNKFQPTKCPTDASLTIYQPPVAEFCVHKIETSEKSYSICALPICSLIIVVKGHASVRASAKGALSRGMIVLAAANEKLDLDVTEAPFQAFRAFCDQFERL